MARILTSDEVQTHRDKHFKVFAGAGLEVNQRAPEESCAVSRS